MKRYRLSDEDGVNAGTRNWGRLALMAIPLVLALGASSWLGFYIGVHQFRRELSQEERAAVAVGAGVRPTSKINIDTQIRQSYCAAVTRADLDGDTLRLYAKNDCHKRLDSMKWHYETLSPNGTVLDQSYNWCSTPSLPNDSAECVFTRLNVDDRVASIRVWTEPITYK